MSETQPQPKKPRRKVKTVKIPLRDKDKKVVGHAEYSKVSDRLAVFHEDNPQASIQTSVELMSTAQSALVRAVISLPRGEFTGHGFGRVALDKSLEKLETIAVGRALAMAGYSAGGEIASIEEMDVHQAKVAATLNEIIEVPRVDSKLMEKIQQGIELGAPLQSLLDLCKTDGERKWVMETWQKSTLMTERDL